MSFFEQTSAQKAMRVQMLVPGFQLSGDLEVLGMIQTFMNDETKGTFTMRNVSVHGLEPQNPAASMQIEELFVRKDQVLALTFADEISREETGLLPRVEQIAAYTSHYVIQGGFHMGTDSLVGDFIVSTRALFIGATDVTIFPLFHSRAAIVQTSSLAYIYAKAVRMHHLV